MNQLLCLSVTCLLLDVVLYEAHGFKHTIYEVIQLGELEDTRRGDMIQRFKERESYKEGFIPMGCQTEGESEQFSVNETAELIVERPAGT